MRKFIRYSLMCFVAMLPWLLIWHLIFMNGWSWVEKEHSRTWLWGDSQLFTGIDASHWDSERPLFSKALHGNGLQDLLLFSERIPKNKQTIIGFGPLYYRVRPDRNQGGLSMDGIKALYQYHVILNRSWKQFLLGLRHNIVSEFSISSLTSNPFEPYDDQTHPKLRAKYVRSMDVFCKKNDCGRDMSLKDFWFLKSLKLLASKSEALQLVSFPVAPELGKTSFDIVFKHHALMLDSISSLYGMPIDTLFVDSNEIEFHDATHLTGRSAASLTSLLSKRLQNENSIILKIMFEKRNSEMKEITKTVYGI